MTNNNLVSYTKQFAYSKIGNALSTSKAWINYGADKFARNSESIAHAAGNAGMILGAVGGTLGLAASLRNDQFNVVFKLNGKVKAPTIRAKSPNDAVTKIKAKYPGGEYYRAFRMPHQDEAAQDYKEALENA